MIATEKGLQRGLSQAARSRRVTQKHQMYGKCWNPGDVIHVIYKVFKLEDTEMYDLCSGDVWGYSVNGVKELGLHTTFIPALCEFDPDGIPVGKPDILYRFSRLAPAFIKGRHEAEVNAAQNKQGITPEMRRNLIRDIDEKYDTQKNKDSDIRPVIGRATTLIVLEAIPILMKDGKPLVDKVNVTMQPASNQLADRLGAILRKPEVLPLEGEEMFIEVEYNYPLAQNKAESGAKVTPAGVARGERIKDKFPEAWDAIKSAMNGFSTDSEMIVKRSTSAVSEARIISALMKYTALHSEDLNSCSLSDEICSTLESSINVVHELNMDSVVTDSRVKEILDKSITEVREETAPAPTVVGETATEITTPDGGKVPNISDLMNQQNMTEMETEDFMQGIDLSAIGAE